MKKIFLILLLPQILIAQDNLSLIKAIKIGLKKNYDVQISAKKNKINQINNNWASAGALPSVNLMAKKEEILSDQSNNPTSFMPYKLRSNNINGNTNVSWTLFNGFAISANKLKLKNLEKISDNAATQTIENTIQAIILQYYNCVLQKERVELLRKVVNLAKNRLKYQQIKYDIGSTSKMELLQIENAMLTDSSNLIFQNLNYTNSVKNLNIILAEDVNKEWIFTDIMDINTSTLLPQK